MNKLAITTAILAATVAMATTANAQIRRAPVSAVALEYDCAVSRNYQEVLLEGVTPGIILTTSYYQNGRLYNTHSDNIGIYDGMGGTVGEIVTNMRNISYLDFTLSSRGDDDRWPNECTIEAISPQGGLGALHCSDALRVSGNLFQRSYTNICR